MLKVSPADENNMLMAQSEYYYYTKVPLIINEIEDMAQKMSGTENNLIKVLMKHSGEKNINFASMMIELLGSDEAKIRDYLAGEELLPFLGNRSEKENIEKVVFELDQYERFMTLTFQSEIGEFPYDPVILLKPEEFLEEAQKRKLNFASEQIQEMVRSHSETVYLLLMQNALRADMCGEEMALPESRFILNSNENIKKWSEYVNKVGLYGPS